MLKHDSSTWFRSIQIGCGLVSLILSSLDERGHESDQNKAVNPNVIIWFANKAI
jgi:hypothetical protein